MLGAEISDFQELENISLKFNDAKAIVPAVLSLFGKVPRQVKPDFINVFEEKICVNYYTEKYCKTMNQRVMTLEDHIEDNE